MTDSPKPSVGSPSPFDDEDNNPFVGGISSLSMENNDDASESMLLYNSQKDTKDNIKDFKSIHMNYESRVTKLLRPSSNVKVQISEAGNSNEGMNNSLKKYIVYTIKLINLDDPSEEIHTRRRYSDFESLRDVLTKIFPLVIIPPIPPKNFINFSMLNGLVGTKQSGNTQDTAAGSNYSYINSKHLNKNKLIEHRKRLLTNFLNNCLHISQIRNLEFFAKFLDPNANWSDETSLIVSQLPDSVYLLNPENGLETDELYSYLPLPVASHGLNSFLKPLLGNKKINKFLGSEETPNDTEQQTEEGNSYITSTAKLDDVNRKIMDNFFGLATDYTDLGTLLNSFSLILAESNEQRKTEESKVNIIFDKVGQIFDRSYITINALIGDLETKFSEPLGEAVQYSSIIRFIDKFQQRKIRQKDMLDADIKEKKSDLLHMLKTDESSRAEGLAEPVEEPRVPKGKFKMPSLKKITRYVSDIMDQNPDLTRKQKITSIEAKVATLEKCQKIMLEDVSYITDEVDRNYKEFHSRELKVIFEILLTYNGFLIGWAKKNIDIWEEVKEEIENL